MNKVTELLDAVVGVITNVRNLADSLQVVADVLTEMKFVEVTNDQPVAQIPEKAAKPKKEKAKVYTLEDVRGVLAEKSQNGLTSEVKGLIAKFGGNKLSDIDPSNYEAIIKEAEVLGNE
ncbi:rRNA biogenesis protein rrp5 [Coprococcus sp. AF27-8]|nr:rRNA biogenesis protein rrp5 [Coprococcus sp. AF27-8]